MKTLLLVLLPIFCHAQKWDVDFYAWMWTEVANKCTVQEVAWGRTDKKHFFLIADQDTLILKISRVQTRKYDCELTGEIPDTDAEYFILAYFRKDFLAIEVLDDEDRHVYFITTKENCAK